MGYEVEQSTNLHNHNQLSDSLSRNWHTKNTCHGGRTTSRPNPDLPRLRGLAITVPQSERTKPTIPRPTLRYHSIHLRRPSPPLLPRNTEMDQLLRNPQPRPLHGHLGLGTRHSPSNLGGEKS